MNTDPFDSWYVGRLDIDEVKNFKAEDWEFTTISCDAGSKEVQQREIERDMVDEWVNQRARPLSSLPGVDLLLTRHKGLGEIDMNFRWIPFGAAHFRHIFESLHLPTIYFHLRGTGGGNSGGSSYRSCRDRFGRVTRITLVIRPAHSVGIMGKSASCAIALSWNAATGRTVGFIDGIPHLAINELAGYIKANSHMLGHPFTVPEMFLHMMIHHLNEGLRIPKEDEFYVEELRTGLSNIRPSKSPHHLIWNWDFKDFQDSTTKVNRYITGLAYLRGRLGFTLQLSRRLSKILEELDTYEFENSHVKDFVREGQAERKERLADRQASLEAYDHQCSCVQKRCDNLITVLYTVLSQMDSRTQSNISKINLQIAHAVRSDSIPMRTIAYITLMLLPGAFVASIFGMNFFRFDERTRSLAVANTFWQYWAVAIPLTICILVLWNLWVWREKREGLGNGNGIGSFRQEPLVEKMI